MGPRKEVKLLLVSPEGGERKKAEGGTPGKKSLGGQGGGLSFRSEQTGEAISTKQKMESKRGAK